MLSTQKASSAPLLRYRTKSTQTSHVSMCLNNRKVIVRLDFHQQEEASVLLANLSASLLHMDVSNGEGLVSAATTIVKGVSNILEYASIVGRTL